jgi:hypothetical protein
MGLVLWAPNSLALRREVIGGVLQRKSQNVIHLEVCENEFILFLVQTTWHSAHYWNDLRNVAILKQEDQWCLLCRFCTTRRSTC